MAMILVNNVALPSPSTFEWGLEDVSSSDAGRTDDTIMHKNRIGQKRKITLSWQYPTREEVATILQAVNPEYLSITYPDAMSGNNETRTFYVGNRTAPVFMWIEGQQMFTSVSFNFIER